MDNKETVKYFYEHITSHNLIDQVPDFVSENCVIKSGMDTFQAGITGMQQHIIDVRKTYPDLTMTIIRQYADGDTVISEFIMEGTHLGEWMGIKPTGKKLSITGVDIDKLADGKIVEHGGAANTFNTFFQEGIIQPA